MVHLPRIRCFGIPIPIHRLSLHTQMFARLPSLVVLGQNCSVVQNDSMMESVRFRGSCSRLLRLWPEIGIPSASCIAPPVFFGLQDCEAKTNALNDSARFHVCARQREIALTAPKLFTKKSFGRIISWPS